MIYLTEYKPRSCVIREGHSEDSVHLHSLSMGAKKNSIAIYSVSPINQFCLGSRKWALSRVFKLRNKTWDLRLTYNVPCITLWNTSNLIIVSIVNIDCRLVFRKCSWDICFRYIRYEWQNGNWTCRACRKIHFCVEQNQCHASMLDVWETVR